MGMTNDQFKSYIRLLVSDIKAVKTEAENDRERNKKIIEGIDEILQNLQDALEE
jgi:hypothetical protein